METNKFIEIEKIKSDTLFDYFNKTLKGISKLSVDKYIEDTLSLKRVDDEISLIIKKLPININNKKLLEIGSGFGSFVLNSRINYNIDSFGVEPDVICYQTSQKILSIYGIDRDIIKNRPGENLSFEDNYFDIVYSSNVLEHVQDPSKIFSEAIRVLRHGGYLFFVVPNYGSWWEGHYGILWFPHLSKNIAKIYVRLLGRDPKYIDKLQFITFSNMKSLVREYDANLEIIEWGWDVWERRLNTLDFSEWASLYKLKKILKVLTKLRMSRLIIYLGKKFGWLTPIILIARKK